MTEITDNRKPLPIALERFVLHWGEMGGQWGVNRSVSQIHALLYLSERPLTADEIADTLGAGALQRLQLDQGAARLEPDPPRADPRRPARSFRGRDRRLGDVPAHRGRAARSARSIRRWRCSRPARRTPSATPRCSPVARARLKDMLGFIEMMERWYTQMLAVPKPQIATAIKLGAKVLNFLPGARKESAERVMPKSERPMRRRKSKTMRSQVAAFEAPLHSPGSEPGLGDLRFRALHAGAEWAALPLAIRRRFSKRLAGGKTAVYVGEVIETQMSRAGWWLAQAARLIGGPLPISRDAARAERRDRDGRRRDARPALDPALRAPARLSAHRAFLQALRRADRPRGICRLRRRHGADHPCRGQRAGLPRRALLPAARPLAPAPAAPGRRPARSP